MEALEVRHVAGHRPGPTPRQEGEARQADRPPPGVLGPRVEKQGAVGRRLRLDAAAVDDDGFREVMSGDPGPVAPRHLLERLVEVARVEAAGYLTRLAVSHRALHGWGSCGRRCEDLGLLIQRKSALSRLHLEVQCRKSAFNLVIWVKNRA